MNSTKINAVTLTFTILVLLVFSAFSGIAAEKKDMKGWGTFRKIILVLLTCFLTFFAAAVCLFLIFPKQYSAFFQKYGSQEQCEKALYDWRWPNGFVCPECGHTGHCFLNTNKFTSQNF